MVQGGRYNPPCPGCRLRIAVEIAVKPLRKLPERRSVYSQEKKCRARSAFLPANQLPAGLSDGQGAISALGDEAPL